MFDFLFFLKKSKTGSQVLELCLAFAYIIQQTTIGPGPFLLVQTSAASFCSTLTHHTSPHQHRDPQAPALSSLNA